MADGLDRLTLWTARAGLLIALAITLWSAFSPPQAGPSLLPWDKAEHFLAFFTLSALALAAFPRVRPIWLGLSLSLLGALIELVQGTPLVNRDCDVWDWVADTIAVLAVMGVMVVCSLRRRLAASRP